MGGHAHPSPVGVGGHGADGERGARQRGLKREGREVEELQLVTLCGYELRGELLLAQGRDGRDGLETRGGHAVRRRGARREPALPAPLEHQGRLPLEGDTRGQDGASEELHAGSPVRKGGEAFEPRGSRHFELPR